MNKCQNCGRKLSPFYFKQCCPDCGVNLMYFNLEERLEQDRLQAEREVSAVRRLLYGIKISTIGTIWGIFRLVAALLQIVVLLIPVYYMESSLELWDTLSLLTVIKAFINPPEGMAVGDLITQQIITDKALLFAMLAFVFVLLFALLSIVLQLFSYTKNGRRRNLVLSVLQAVVFLGLSIAAAVNGAALAGGFYAQVALAVVLVILGIPLEKAVRQHMLTYDPGAQE